MNYYHGSNLKNWERIQKDGWLRAQTKDLRLSNSRKSLHLSKNPEQASDYGEIVLQVECDGEIIPANGGTSLATMILQCAKSLYIREMIWIVQASIKPVIDHVFNIFATYFLYFNDHFLSTSILYQ
jgi:hypothetical protein